MQNIQKDEYGIHAQGTKDELSASKHAFDGEQYFDVGIIYDHHYVNPIMGRKYRSMSGKMFYLYRMND